MKSFFEELKRRNVVRVGIAYVITAWLLLQVTNELASVLELPILVAQGVLALLVIGFPVTLLLAWYYECQAGWLIKDEDAKRDHIAVAAAHRKLDMFIIGGLAVALIYFVADKFYLAGPDEATVWVPRALTSIEGFEIDPALSPDGTKIAYIWRRSENLPGDLFVRSLDSNDPLQLTDTEAFEGHPVWSPDSSEIAFVRVQYPGSMTEGGYDIVTMPAFGGAERILHRTRINFLLGLDWSPDGEMLYFRDLDPDSPNPNGAIYTHRLTTGDQRQITFPMQDPDAAANNFNVSDRLPTISPNGELLAFARWRHADGMLLCLIRLGADKPMCRRTNDFEVIFDIGWSPDSESIYYLRNKSVESQDRELVQVSTLLEDPRIVSTAFGALGFATARNVDKLVLESRFEDHNIWRIRGPAQSEPGVPELLIGSTRNDMWPSYSPDADKIAFVSHMSGDPKLWVADADGAASRNLGGNDPIFPRWNPRGEKIIFSGVAQRDGEFESRPSVFEVAESGGYPQRLFDELGAVPSYSRDEAHIYFQTLPDAECIEGHTVLRVRRDGTDRKVIAECATFGVEGPNARVYYFNDLKESLSSVDWDAGDARVEYETPEYVAWGVSEKFLAVVDREDLWLKIIDLESGQKTNWAKLWSEITLPTFGPYASLTISWNGEWIAYTSLDRAGSDLTLLEPAN